MSYDVRRFIRHNESKRCKSKVPLRNQTISIPWQQNVLKVPINIVDDERRRSISFATTAFNLFRCMAQADIWSDLISYAPHSVCSPPARAVDSI